MLTLQKILKRLIDFSQITTFNVLSTEAVAMYQSYANVIDIQQMSHVSPSNVDEAETPPQEYEQVTLDRLGKTLTEAHRHAHQTQQRARKNAVSYLGKNSNCTCKCTLLSLTLALILITQLAIAMLLYSRESDVKLLETTRISKGDMKILISEYFNDAQKEAIHRLVFRTRFGPRPILIPQQLL